MRYAGLFADAVDEGLGVLGEIPKRTIYEFLQTEYSMKRDDIPARFTEFSRVLRDNMGLASDQVLAYIVDGFYMKLQMEPPEWDDLNEGIRTVDRLLQDGPANEIRLNIDKPSTHK